MELTVQPVVSRGDLEVFIGLPLRLYRGDACYVPPLAAERRKFFNPRRNPLFEFIEVGYFLARDQAGQGVGRITAHIDRRHNERWNERAGFFGFFESIKDLKVARALLTTAEAWLRERKMEIIRGPFNFSTNEECGLLTAGFDKPPAILMPYSKDYYIDFMDWLGYASAKEMVAYHYESDGTEPPYLARFNQRGAARANVTIRALDLRRFDDELARAFAVYNEAWAENWGFVPMSEAEFRFVAGNLRPWIDPALALLAERDGRPVGFSLALPDLNPILKNLKGRLWPLGALRILLGKRQITQLRVIALGVVEEHRRRGIDALLIGATLRNGWSRGYRSCEMSWVLEDNLLMRRTLERMGATVTKRYRIFQKPL